MTRIYKDDIKALKINRLHNIVTVTNTAVNKKNAHVTYSSKLDAFY